MVKMKKKGKGNYIFPDFLGQAMSKIDMRTQLEASMMSMTLILAGMIVTIFYMAFYVELPTWYKVTLVINLLAGLLFISSFIVTTFQQYKSYLNAIEFQNEVMKGGTQ